MSSRLTNTGNNINDKKTQLVRLSIAAKRLLGALASIFHYTFIKVIFFSSYAHNLVNNARSYKDKQSLEDLQYILNRCYSAPHNNRSPKHYP